MSETELRADNARLRGDIHIYDNTIRRLLKAQETILQIDHMIRLDILRRELSDPVAVSDGLVRAARAIAANKRGLSVEDPEVERVYRSYIGQARAAIEAFHALQPEGRES